MYKSLKYRQARFPSGQRGRTVNPLAYVFVGSNPTLATKCGNSSIGRAAAFQAVGCGFESRFPLHSYTIKKCKAFLCWRSSVVEQLICNQQVVGSNPIASSKRKKSTYWAKMSCVFLIFYLFYNIFMWKIWHFGPRSSGVEHFLGKEEVTGSNPVAGSRRAY